MLKVAYRGCGLERNAEGGRKGKQEEGYCFFLPPALQPTVDCFELDILAGLFGACAQILRLKKSYAKPLHAGADFRITGGIAGKANA